jgi:hypothetical protein
LALEYKVAEHQSFDKAREFGVMSQSWKFCWSVPEISGEDPERQEQRSYGPFDQSKECVVIVG